MTPRKQQSIRDINIKIDTMDILKALKIFVMKKTKNVCYYDFFFKLKTL